MDIDLLITQTQARVAYTRHELAVKCRTLIMNLESVETRLLSDKPSTPGLVNSCGEIQGTGPIIDTECGRLGAEMRSLEELMALKGKGG